MSGLNVFVLDNSQESMNLISETKKNIVSEIKRNARELRAIRRKEKVIDRYLDYRPHLWVVGLFISIFHVFFDRFTDNPVIWYYVNLSSKYETSLYARNSELYITLNSLISYEYHINGDSCISEIEVYSDEYLLYNKLKEAIDTLPDKKQ